MQALLVVIGVLLAVIINQNHTVESYQKTVNSSKKELRLVRGDLSDLQDRVQTNMSELEKLLTDAQNYPLKPLSDENKIAISPVQMDKFLDFLTDRQVMNLLKAYDIGNKYNLGLAAMGVCMQETLCGETLLVGHRSQPVGKRSYGLMQVKVSAYRDVAKKFSYIEQVKTDEMVIAKLLLDDEFNMTIAVHYLMILQEQGLSWREMLTAYNLGLKGSERVENRSTYKYTEKVVKHIREKKFQELISEYESNS